MRISAVLSTVVLVLTLGACSQQGSFRIAGAYDMMGVVTATNSSTFEVGDEEKTNVTVFVVDDDVEVVFYGGFRIYGTRAGNAVSLTHVDADGAVEYSLIWSSDQEFSGTGRTESLATGEFVEFDVTGTDIKTAAAAVPSDAEGSTAAMWQGGW